MVFQRLFIFVLGLWLLAHAPAMAERADRDQPMQIEADRADHDEQQRLTLFTGRVQATKGTLVLRAERLEVREEIKGQQQAQLWPAPGQRVFFRQKREGLNEYIEGEAEHVAFDNQQELLTLTRRAEIRVLRGAQMADRMQGERIVYNQTTEVIHVDGQLHGTSLPGRQRVRAVLVPRDSASASSPASVQLKPGPLAPDARQP